MRADVGAAAANHQLRQWPPAARAVTTAPLTVDREDRAIGAGFAVGVLER